MIILVDGDNIGCNFWAFVLNTLTEQDGLLLFYTDKSPSLSIETLRKITESEFPLLFIHCQMGTNALDFQLSSYLGYLIAQEPDNEFAILSDDNGYGCVVSFWKKSGYKVKQIRCADLEKMKKHSVLRLEIRDDSVEMFDYSDIRGQDSASETLYSDDNNLFDAQCEKNVFHELLFVFNRKIAPITSAIDYLGLSAKYGGQLGVLKKNDAAFSKTIKGFPSESQTVKAQRYLKLVSAKNRLDLTDDSLTFIAHAWLEKESLTSFRMKLLNRFPGVGDYYYNTFKETISLLGDIK